MRHGTPGEDVDRAGALLRAASVLLAGNSQLLPVGILHREVRGAIEESERAVAAYDSRASAEEEHRRLLLQLASKRLGVRAKGRLRWLRINFPRWAAWTMTGAVVAGLMLRYAYAVFDRERWRRQYPDGKWISRYYPKQRFQGTSLVRYDVAVDYRWGSGSPAEAMQRDNWSARWDTCIVVTANTKVRLRLAADDKARLLVDDAVLLDVRKPGAKKSVIKLHPGVQHLQIEFQEGRRGAKLQLQGLNFEGTDSYRFERPVLIGDDVHCEGVQR